MGLTRIGVKNFRCIQDMELDLPPLTVVIGPNGAGKTTFLHCLRMLGRLASGRLNESFTEYGGFDASFFWNSDERFMGFDTAAEADGAFLEYSILLRREGTAYYVPIEQVKRKASRHNDSQKPREAFVLPLQIPPGQTPIAQKTAEPGYLMATSELEGWLCAGDGKVGPLPRGKQTEALITSVARQNSEITLLVDTLHRISHWNVIALSLSEHLRRPQPLQPAEIPSPTGDNLLSVLYGLKTQKRHVYQELQESLQVAFPELEAIELPLAGKGFASLNWHQKGLDKPLDAQQLSDGTLRLLWLTTLLFTVPDDGVVLIDEPEISLHPQWLMFLVSLLRQTSARTQIVVATHSDQLIRWLEPHELLVADIEDGRSTFRWGSEMNLDEWLKDYTLDRLWHMGELGGRR